MAKTKQIWLRNEEEYVALAYTLYYRWCTRNGYIGDMPNQNLSGFEGEKKIVLRNINGTLAGFKIDINGHLHLIEIGRLRSANPRLCAHRIQPLLR